MPDYEAMYRLLFNRITDAEKHIKEGSPDRAMAVLMKAQLDTERMYIEGRETEE